MDRRHQHGGRRGLVTGNAASTLGGLRWAAWTAVLVAIGGLKLLASSSRAVFRAL
jgi:hypothetical protein